MESINSLLRRGVSRPCFIEVCTFCSRLQNLKNHEQTTVYRSRRQRSYHSKGISLSKNDVKSEEFETAKQFEDIPGPKGMYSLPYIGFALQLKPFTNHSLDQFVNRIAAWHKKYGDIFKQRLGNEWFVYLTNPVDIEKVFRADRRYPFRAASPLFAVYEKRRNRQPGLLSLNGAEWQEVRSPTQKFLLRASAVAKYAPLTSQLADEFVGKFHNKDHVNDMLYHLMEYSTECVGKLCFDKRLGCITHSDRDVKTETMQQVETLLDCFSIQFYIFPWYRLFRTPFYKRFESAADFIFKETRKQIEEHLARRRQHETLDQSDPSLLVDLLMHSGLTPDQVEKTMFDVFLGGVDSTANSLVFVLFNLARNPDKQEKLYKELTSYVDRSGVMTQEVFQQLPYLKACVKESFRVVFPITAGTSRSLDKDIVIQGYKIPAYTHIHLCSGIAGMKSEYFRNPDRFVPERWLRGDSEREVVNPFAHIPFGFGPRKCIGQTFAEQDIYICVAKLIRNFKLKLPEGVTTIPYRYKTFATPTQRVDFLLEPR